MTYLDTCVVAALLVPEPQSDKVQQALNHVHRPVISRWVDVEFYGLVARHFRMKLLNQEKARHIIQTYQTLSKTHFGYVDIEQQDFDLASQLVATLGLGLRPGDALHLAICQKHQNRLFTIDIAFLKIAKKLKLKVIEL